MLVSLAMSEISLETLVSSAYSLTVDEIPDEMSFTYKMKKTGPRIVPWGNPDKTGDQDEQVAHRTTRCIRPVKKLRNHRRALASIP